MGMDENKAADELRKRAVFAERYYKGEAKEYAEVLKTAVQALEEVQQYRAIGTVGECRAAVGKQRPVEPLLDAIYKVGFYCPDCEEFLAGRFRNEKHPCCPYCGQRILWAEDALP